MSGKQRNAKRIERNREPASNRLDVGFFARPAVEECGLLFFIRHRFQIRALIGAEEAARNVEHIRHAVDLLYIHSNLAIERHRARGQRTRMRKVESKARIGIGQARLSLFVVTETDLLRLPL